MVDNMVWLTQHFLSFDFHPKFPPTLQHAYSFLYIKVIKTRLKAGLQGSASSHGYCPHGKLTGLLSDGI